MKIKTLQLIIICTVTCFSAQAAVSEKQAIAQQGTLALKDAQEIQKVWKKTLAGFANRDIASIMETISPNYSKSIDWTTIIDYAGFRKIAEQNDAEFFEKYASCFVKNIKILKSNVTGDKAAVEFEYQLNAFNKNSMRWETYGIIQEVTFVKENSQWKIITSGDKKKLY